MTQIACQGAPLVLVTGAAGRLGSAVVHRLLQDGARVVAVDSLVEGDVARLAPASAATCRFIQADVRDGGALKAAVEGAAHVIHLAEIRHSSGSAIDALSVNVEGVEAVLEAAREANAAVVFGSSTVVLGRTDVIGAMPDQYLIMGEADDRVWDYPVAKMLAEHLCWAYHERYGLAVKILRFAPEIRDVPWPLPPTGAQAAAFAAAVDATMKALEGSSRCA